MNEMPATQKSSPTRDFTQKKSKKITISYLENAGAYYLQRFPASIHQFRQVMSRKITNSCRDHTDQDKSACLQMLETVIQKFMGLGYLNDKAYAQALLFSLKQKSLPRGRIASTMRQKGLADEIIQEALPADDAVDNLTAAIGWMRRKKLGPYATRERENQQQRHLASLARAGFSYDCAQKALALPREEADDLLSGKISY